AGPPNESRKTKSRKPAAGAAKRIARLVVGGLLLAIAPALFLLPMTFAPRSANDTPATAHSVPQPVAVQPLEGDLDVRIDAEEDKGHGYIGLDDAQALPLKSDDGYIIVATVTRPAYAYVVLIKPDGEVLPIYPWTRPGDWTSRPQHESPLTPEHPF